MHATEAQLSPIFGLCPDDAGAAASSHAGSPRRGSGYARHRSRAHAERVEHEVWTVDDAGLIRNIRRHCRARTSSSPTAIIDTPRS